MYMRRVFRLESAPHLLLVQRRTGRFLAMYFDVVHGMNFYNLKVCM